MEKKERNKSHENRTGCKKYGISRDHLYYYINYGLLVPPKIEKQYVFDETVLQDLDRILELQKLGFALKDIHRILSLQRISNGGDGDTRKELLALFRARKEKSRQELAQLEQRIQVLNQKIKELTVRKTGPVQRTGVPLSMLDLLVCPHCQKTLSFDKVEMDPHYVYQAALSCSCGYQAQIKDGILLTPHRYTDPDDTPDLHRLMYKDLPGGMISLFQQAYNFMDRQLDGMELSGKVILESYINAWFFLYTQQSHFAPDARYIVVDKYPETLAMYKKLMEYEPHPLPILYIADSTLQLPLRKQCIDLNIDFFAANEHNFYRPTFFYQELLPLLSPHSRILGTYFYFENGSKSMANLLGSYPKCSQHNFSLPWFLRNLENGDSSLKKKRSAAPAWIQGKTSDLVSMSKEKNYFYIRM